MLHQVNICNSILRKKEKLQYWKLRLIRKIEVLKIIKDNLKIKYQIIVNLPY